MSGPSATGWITIIWKGTGRTATSRSVPRWPDGIDLDLTADETRRCRVRLPYPAPEVGAHLLVCRHCGVRVAVTAAGRPDDPRSVTIPCRAISEECRDVH